MRISLLRAVFLTLLIGFGLLVGAVSADDHDEAVDGPVSANGLSPTAINGTLGSNIIDGSVNNYPDVRYFSIEVPTGLQITAINHIEDVDGDGGNWFAAMVGPQFTQNSTDQFDIDTSKLLGHAVIGPNYGGVPQNVMSRMGFDAPLPPDTYSFRIQNWGSGVDFAFNIELSEVGTTAVSLSQPQATHALPALISLLTLLVCMTGLTCLNRVSYR